MCGGKTGPRVSRAARKNIELPERLSRERRDETMTRGRADWEAGCGVSIGSYRYFDRVRGDSFRVDTVSVHGTGECGAIVRGPPLTDAFAASPGGDN